MPTTSLGVINQPLILADGGVDGAAPRSLVRWVPVLLLIALLLGFAPHFESGGGPMDEGMLLLYPELVLQGHVPYRDFESFYGPGNLWTLAAAYSVFGIHITVERSVGLVYRLLLLVALFGLCRRWGIVAGAGVMLLAGLLLHGTGVIAYAWMGAVACGLCALWAGTDAVRPGRCFVAGLCAAWAILFRIDLGPAILIGVLPFLCRFDRRQLLVFGAAFAFGLLPLAVLTIVAGPTQMLNNLFIYPVFRCNVGRHLPLGSAEPWILRLFIFHCTAVLLNFAAGVMAFRRRKTDPAAITLLCLVLFSAGVSHQAYQRLDFIHLLCSAFLSFALLPISIGELIGGRRSFVFAWAGVTAVTCLVATPLAGAVVAGLRSALTTQPVGPVFAEHNGRSFPAGGVARAILVEKMLTDLEANSTAGQRLFVGPRDLRRTNYCDTYVYHLLPKLIPATYFLEMNPLSANRPNSRLAADIATADWLILNKAWDSFNEPNASSVNGSELPQTVVSKHFSLVASYGSFGLFRRKPDGPQQDG